MIRNIKAAWGALLNPQPEHRTIVIVEKFLPDVTFDFVVTVEDLGYELVE